jgi:NAD(P)-dependent dehydrogenase (short-subunit alcohol dehydrogenase family)
MKLDGKVAFITGAARGMGRSHCLKLAKEGADIIACDIKEDLLFETVKQVKAIGRHGMAIVVDISKNSEVKDAVSDAINKFSHIDILVNNAGILRKSLIHETSESDWDDVLSINLKGVWLCIKYIAPYMMKVKSGKIINIASTEAFIGTPNLAAYCASKFGVMGLTKVAAIELAPYNVNVNAVAPSSTKTDMMRELAEQANVNLDERACELATKHLFNRLVEPIDISNTVAWLASDEAKNITGSCIIVDAGRLTKPN